MKRTCRGAGLRAPTRERPPATRRGGLLGRWAAAGAALAWVVGMAVADGAPGALPAFPGAEGAGRHTPGGRGGRVLFVTNLQDDGAGSLRAACAAPGPRLVVFRTGGTIHLERPLLVTEPFLTVAGQTAPGDGICVRGGTLRIRTHDVIIRGLRVRVGDELRYDHADEPDAINLLAGSWPRDERDGPGRDALDAAVHDIILDHCSLSWAIDENLGLWSLNHADPAGRRVERVTIQYCLLSEGLRRSLHHKGEHSKGLLVGHRSRAISIHHCLLAHHQDRNPALQGGTETEVVNNVVYNWDLQGLVLGDWADVGWMRANLIGNSFLPGPDTLAGPEYRRAGPPEAPAMTASDRALLASRVYRASRFHLSANLCPRQPDPHGDPAQAVEMGFCPHPLREMLEPLPVVAPTGITVQDPAEALTEVLDRAGALAPRRDSVDERVVRSVRTRTGRIIDSPAEVGGYPDYDPGQPPPDRDGDGLPDAWETGRGLDPDDPRTATALAPDGYSWIEVYVNGFLDPVSASPSPARPAP